MPSLSKSIGWGWVIGLTIRPGSITAPVLSLVLLIASAALAQMPEGWRDLPAEGFLQAVTGAIEAGGQEFEGRAEVDQHAWQAFLLDEAFASEGSWSVVVEMVERFGGSAASAGVDQQGVDAMLERVGARGRSDLSTMTGVDLFEFGEQAKRLQTGGLSSADASGMFAAWAGENEWESLELNYVYNLYSFMAADAVDRRKFSVRWTGFLKAPRDGEYVFRQVPQYGGADSRVLLRIDGRTVIDSRTDSSDAERFTSSPIALSANAAVPISVEMQHEVDEIDFSRGAPMVVVTWESAGLARSLIPPSAFSTGVPGSAESVAGLTGEYFRGLDFVESVGSRVEPGLQLASSWPPAFPKYEQTSRAVFEEGKSRILDPQYLRSCVERGDDEAFSHFMWRIAYRMTPLDRQRLVELLLNDQQLLAYMTPQMMGRLYQGVYFLPSGDQVTLLGEWSLARPQPRTEPGLYPGWSDGSYQKLNTDFYWLMGYMMQRTHAISAQRLLDEYLIRPDGECNLPIAYLLSFAGDERSLQPLVLERIERELEEGELSGDQRATWLIGKAFVEGVLPRGGPPQIDRGLGALKEASGGAASEDYKRWVLTERLSRLASCGECEAARDVLSAERDLLGGESPSRYASWDAAIDALEAERATRATVQRQEHQEAYARELARRQKRAVEQGASRSRDEYTRLLDLVKPAAE